jgi:MSHA biogenesis protein MshI
VPGLVGVEVGPDGIAVAHIHESIEGLPVVSSCRYLPNDDEGAAPLADYIRESGLRGARCNVVLAANYYDLILAEAPAVDDAELNDAMRWKAQELIDFPIEEAAIDVFRLADDARRGTQMAYVAISRRALIDDIISMISDAGLQLVYIDIMELALRNLGLQFPDLESDKHGRGIVQLSPGTGNFNIIRNQQLYLSRRFEINWEGGVSEPLPMNELTLDLQRCLDYYESQMNQAPPSRIYICGEGVSIDKLTADHQTSYVGELRILPLNQLVRLPEGSDEQAITRCVGAIGGAMRELEVK